MGAPGLPGPVRCQQPASSLSPWPSPMYQTKTDTEMDGLVEAVLLLFKGNPPSLPPIQGKSFLTDSRKGMSIWAPCREGESPLQVGKACPLCFHPGPHLYKVNLLKGSAASAQEPSPPPQSAIPFSAPTPKRPSR